MKIIVIGASRGIGREVVKAALEAGHTVTAFSRHPETIDIQNPKLRLQTGNVLDAPSLKAAMKGQDAVICTLGLSSWQAIGPPFAKRSYVLSSGTRNIIDILAAGKIRRFICVTAIGAGDSASQCTPLARLTLRWGLRWLFQEKDRQEDSIKSSGLQWTIIRPTALTHGKKQGAILGEKLRSGILTHVSRADVAAVIIKIIDQTASYQKAFAVSYPPRIGDSLRWVAGYFGKA